jgi:hypothetical protein
MNNNYNNSAVSNEDPTGSASLSYSISYWNSCAPHHQVTAIAANSDNSILLSAATQSELVVWKKYGNNNDNEELTAEGMIINRRSAVAPSVPLCTVLIYVQLINTSLQSSDNVDLDAANYFLACFTSGLMCKYSEAADECIDRHWARILLKNCSKGEAVSNEDCYISNVYHYALDSEHDYLLAQFNGSSDVYILECDEFCILHKIQQPSLVRAVHSVNNLLFVLTDENILLQWDLKQLFCTVNAQVSNDNLIISFTDNCCINTKHIKSLQGNNNIVQFTASHDNSRLLILSSKQWLVLESTHFKPILTVPVLSAADAAFYGVRNDIVILLKNNGKIKVYQLKNMKESVEAGYSIALKAKLKLPNTNSTFTALYSKDNRIYCGTKAGEIISYTIAQSVIDNEGVTDIFPATMSKLSDGFFATTCSSLSGVCSHSLLISYGLHDVDITSVIILLARGYESGVIQITRLLASHSKNNESNDFSQMIHRGQIGQFIAINSHENIYNKPLLISTGSEDYTVVILELLSSSILLRLNLCVAASNIILCNSIISSELQLGNIYILAKDLICVVCDDHSCTVIFLSNLDDSLVLRGHSAAIQHIYRYSADFIYNRIIIETTARELYIWNLADGSLEELISPHHPHILTMLQQTKPSVDVEFELLENLEWAAQQPAASPLSNTEADVKSSGGLLSSLAATPITWLKAASKYLYRSNKPQQASHNSASNDKNAAGASNEWNELISYFDSYAQLNLTVYTININSLANLLQSDYSSLLNPSNSSSADKSLVYKALLAPLLDYDIPYLSNIFKQFQMSPPDPSNSFTTNSCQGNCYFILFPRSSKATRRWSCSGYMTAQHSLVITTILYSLLVNTDARAHNYYSQLEYYYNSHIIKDLQHNYTQPDVAYLGKYLFSGNTAIHNAVNLLIKSLLQRLSSAGRSDICKQFLPHLNSTDAHESVFNAAPEEEEKAADSTVESIMSSAHRSDSKLSRTKTLSKLLNQTRLLIRNNSKQKNPGKSPPAANLVAIPEEALDKELYSCLLLSTAQQIDKRNKEQIAHSTYQQYAPHMCRCLVRVIAHVQRGLRLRLALELLSADMESLQPHLVAADVEPLLTRLFSLYCQQTQANESEAALEANLSTGNQSTAALILQLLSLLADSVPQLFMLVLGRFLIDSQLNVAIRKAAAMCLLNLLKCSRSESVHSILPLAIHLIMRAMQQTQLRAALAASFLHILSILNNSYASCSFHAGSAAHSAVFALANELSPPAPCVVVWDIAAGKRIKTFPIKGSINTVAFNASGDYVAVYSAELSVVNVYQLYSSLSTPRKLFKSIFKLQSDLIAAFPTTAQQHTAAPLKSSDSQVNQSNNNASAAAEEDLESTLMTELEARARSESLLIAAPPPPAVATGFLSWKNCPRVDLVWSEGGEILLRQGSDVLATYQLSS